MMPKGVNNGHPSEKASSASNVPANWLRESRVASREESTSTSGRFSLVAPIFFPVSTSRFDDTGDIHPRAPR